MRGVGGLASPTACLAPAEAVLLPGCWTAGNRVKNLIPYAERSREVSMGRD